MRAGHLGCQFGRSGPPASLSSAVSHSRMPRDLREWSDFGEEPRPDEALKSGDLRAALSAFALQHLLEFRRKRMNSDDPAIGFGVTLWLLGDVYGAAMLWSKVCDEAIKGRYPYSSQETFQSGLLLWFASVWLKDEDWHSEAESLFDKLLGKNRPVMAATFQRRLAKLLRREMDLPQIEAEYSAVALFRERQQTQALFYAGVRAFEDGNAQETKRLWQQVKTPENSLVELEYYLLLHERERLSKRG
jgi:hypothetical protein